MTQQSKRGRLTLPPYLYHGTTGQVARRVIGGKPLVPRKSLPDGLHSDRWNGLSSNENMVYLSTCYAASYAHRACGGDSAELGILEIDTAKLDKSLFYPDEDSLAHMHRATGSVDDPLNELTLKELVEFFRDILAMWGPYAGVGLELSGTIAYGDAIPPSAITRAALFDCDSNADVSLLIADTGISPRHYKFCGAQAVALQSWLFCDKANAADILGDTPESDAVLSEPGGWAGNYLTERYKHWGAVLEKPGRQVLRR